MALPKCFSPKLIVLVLLMLVLFCSCSPVKPPVDAPNSGEQPTTPLSPKLVAMEASRSELQTLGELDIVEMRTYFSGQLPTSYTACADIAKALEWLDNCHFVDHREHYPTDMVIDEQPELFSFITSAGVRMDFTLHARYRFFTYRIGEAQSGVFISGDEWVDSLSVVRELYQQPGEDDVRAVAAQLLQRADELQGIYLGDGLRPDVPTGVPIALTGTEADYYPVRSTQFRQLADLEAFVRSTYIPEIAELMINQDRDRERPRYKDKEGRLHVDLNQGGLGPLFSHDYATVHVLEQSPAHAVVAVERPEIEGIERRIRNLYRRDGRWLLGYGD